MARNRNLPRLGVLYDQGSAGAVDVFMASRGLCEPVFVVDRDNLGDAAPALTTAPPGALVDITGMNRDTAAKELDANGIQHIITFSERQLLTTAELAEQAELVYLPVRTAELCRDKLKQRQALADAGVDVVRTVVVSDPAELESAIAHVGLPAVVKPRNGMGSTNTMRANTVDEAVRWVSKLASEGDLPELVVEEMLVGDPTHAGEEWGDYVSVESIVDCAGVSHVSVTGKFPLSPPFRERGMVYPNTLTDAMTARCERVAEAALRALGVSRGVTHTELKLTPTGPRVIEVNARMGGYVADIVRRATGYDLIKAALRNAVGQPAVDLPVAAATVSYQYFVQPPVDAELITRIDGADRLTDIPGVTAFEQHLSAGDPVGWRWGTDRYVGVLFGEADTHEQVLKAVETALATLRISYA